MWGERGKSVTFRAKIWQQEKGVVTPGEESRVNYCKGRDERGRICESKGGGESVTTRDWAWVMDHLVGASVEEEANGIG